MGLNIKELNKRIAAKNAEFAALSPAQKRVAIAIDVVEQLQSRNSRLVPRNGTYMTAGKASFKLEPGQKLDKVFSKIESCQVCAIGAAFMCSVGRLDAISTDDLLAKESFTSFRLCADVDDIDDIDMVDYLISTGAFTREQVRRLEAVFEGYGEYGYSGGFIADLQLPSILNFKKEEDFMAARTEVSLRRMERIFLYIIEHNGSVNFPTKALSKG
jgi:hypothetical protein